MFLTLKNKISQITEQAEILSIDELLLQLSNQFSEEVIFSTSFSYEDQIITHKILSNQLPIKIFTLDTGRLFPETYSAEAPRYHDDGYAVPADHDQERTMGCRQARMRSCFLRSPGNRAAIQERDKGGW